MKQKLLFDENIGYAVVRYFRFRGYDVTSILEDCRGMADRDIVSLAVAETRIIVTLDKDFADLVFYFLVESSGIVLLRLSDESQDSLIAVLSFVLETYGGELVRSFTTVKDFEVRLRSLP